jgi:succinate dehydrogenase / fumarate reductase, cytochrome b subunit
MSVVRFLQSSILSKVVMAVTGVVLVLFILGHMAGNLQMWIGADQMNTYAHFLQSLGEILWLIRLVLVLCAVLHVITSIRLKFLNMSSRPDRYAMKKWVKAGLTSRTMLWTGSFVFVFIVYHLMHYTLRTTNPEYYKLTAAGWHDVYRMVVLSYQNAAISVAYIVFMILLAFHLNHAISSAFQTLGINHAKYNGFITALGPVLSIILAIGFCSIPLGVLAGWIALPAGAM